MKTLYPSKTKKDWLKNEITTLTRYTTKLYDEEERITADRLLNKQINQVSFYQITPKQDLPKNLQKMSFQTLNTKQMNGNSIIKVYRKQPMTWKQNKVRKIMRQNGEILMLSEIYNYFDDALESRDKKDKITIDEIVPLANVVNQLDQWEKNINRKSCNEQSNAKLKLPNLHGTDELKTHVSGKKEQRIKKFRIGEDYSKEIIKNIQIINNGYHNDKNIITKYTQIQANSKLLKKQLEETKEFVKKQINDIRKKLIDIRKQHHRLYQQKQKLYKDEHELDEQQKYNQQQSIIYPTSNELSYKNGNEDKKNDKQKNQMQINKIKKNIQLLEEQKYQYQQQLKNILKAQQIYYQISLKYGLDCRDNGLGWLIKKLGYEDQDIIYPSFPQHLDKKSKIYLLTKSKNQDNLEILVKNKKSFVNLINADTMSQSKERRSSIRRFSSKNSIKFQKPLTKNDQIDGIKESTNEKSDVNDIPKRYNRSMKKITALRQQSLRDTNLLKYTIHPRNGLNLGTDLIGLNGRQIYRKIVEKIKRVDFTKLKKQKNEEKNEKMYEYQDILKKIENLHMQMQQQDLQHQNYLLTQYKGNKQLFFNIAAACFGIKRAHVLIIKNFSWKNSV